MKNKTTKRVKSILELGEIIEECKPRGMMFNHNQAHLMFEDYNGVRFSAQILSNGSVKLEYLDDKGFKPYKWVNEYDYKNKSKKVDKPVKIW